MKSACLFNENHVLDWRESEGLKGASRSRGLALVILGAFESDGTVYE